MPIPTSGSCSHAVRMRRGRSGPVTTSGIPSRSGLPSNRLSHCRTKRDSVSIEVRPMRGSGYSVPDPWRSAEPGSARPVIDGESFVETHSRDTVFETWAWETWAWETWAWETWAWARRLDPKRIRVEAQAMGSRHGILYRNSRERRRTKRQSSAWFRSMTSDGSDPAGDARQRPRSDGADRSLRLGARTG